MNIIGVVSEYNPFHNGHAYHLAMSRRMLGGDCPVVCVMSGDFVQRGEPALYSKFARAEAACRSGADLVLELPLPWALSSAEGFARGAVGLLTRLGVTHLSFGSESGELEPLDHIARSLLDPMLTVQIRERMAQERNLSFPAARQQVLEEELGELARQLEMPNNILAVEYLKAIYELDSTLRPITVLRFGSGHDREGSSGPRSASELRRALLNGTDISPHIPAEAAAVYHREREQGRELNNRPAVELAMLSRLRMFDEAYYNNLPDAAEGLGSRIYRAVQEESTLDAVLAAAKTRRYPLARIRRICMCACLGIKAGMNEGMPPYARVLAANERGCELLHAFSRKSSLPILTKPAAVRQLSPESVKLFALGAQAHDFFTLAYPSPGERKGNQDWRKSPVIVKNI